MIIFDWDGTLCDSTEHIVHAMRAAASELALAEPEVEQVRNIIGLGLPQAVLVLFPDEPEAMRQEIARAYAGQYIAAEQEPPQLFAGAMETLHQLRGRGLQLAVATGKSRRGLDRILNILGLTDFFDATRCADETRSKPHPLMLEEIMAECAVPEQQVTMVGDTEYDLEMATNAGVSSIGVSFGVHSLERLEKHAPVAIVDELPQLLDLEILSRSL